MSALSDKVAIYQSVGNVVELETLVIDGFVPPSLRDQILNDKRVFVPPYSLYKFLFPVEVAVSEGKAEYKILFEKGGANG